MENKISVLCSHFLYRSHTLIVNEFEALMDSAFLSAHSNQPNTFMCCTELIGHLYELCVYLGLSNGVQTN